MSVIYGYIRKWVNNLKYIYMKVYKKPQIYMYESV